MISISEIFQYLALDWKTFLVLAVLCVFSSYFIKEYLAIPAFIIFVYPVLLCFSIACHRMIIALEAYPPKKLDAWLMWTIMAAIVGNFVGTCVVAILGRLREQFDRRPPPQIPARSTSRI